VATKLTISTLLLALCSPGLAAAGVDDATAPASATAAAREAELGAEAKKIVAARKAEADEREARCSLQIEALKTGTPMLPGEDQQSFNRCIETSLAFATGGDVATDFVQTAAQVVVDKVERQGWAVLLRELQVKANCGAQDSRFSNLCKVLGTVTIQDLVSSPEVLLDAAAVDILRMLLDASKKESPQALTALHAIIANALVTLPGAYALGPDVVARQWQEKLFAQFRARVKTSLACQKGWTSPEQAAWVAGMCFVERPSKNALADCDFDAWEARCPNEAGSLKPEKTQLFLLSAREAFGKGDAKSRLDATVRLAFSLAAAQLVENAPDSDHRAALAWLDATQDVTLGLLGRDWVRAISGASRTAALAVNQGKACSATPSDSDCKERTAGELKVLALLAAIGNYAATYVAKDAKQAQADRVAVMHELVDRMVSRSSIESGAKFSIGGSLGLLGGVRTDFDEGKQAAFPVQLGLGVGVQTYGRGNGGFHLMATFLDVGQYVTFENSKLKVDEPDLESSVTLGLTIGGWICNREVPLYVGAYGGISPFVRASGDPTYQLGVATGFYAPLLDFN
jgi:hypothetical protein